MVKFFRLFLAILVIAILFLQKSTENRLLRLVNLFLNQKRFNRLIWIFIVFFLIITFFAELLTKDNINFGQNR